jgi:signal transduction histidine kinase
MKNWKVSTKLIAVLLAPLLVLIALAWFGISERRDEASSASRASELTELAAQNSSLIHALQIEMVFSAAHQASGGEAVTNELADARANTDEALDDLVAYLDDFDIAAESEEFQEAVGVAQTRIEALNTVRQAIDDDVHPTLIQAIEGLDVTIQDLLQVNQQVAAATDTPGLSDELRNYVVYSRSKGDAARSTAILAGVLVRPDAMFAVEDGESPEFEAFRDEIQTEDDYLAAFDENASPEQKALLRNEGGPQLREADNIIADALAAGEAGEAVTRADGESIPPSEWLVTGTDKLQVMLDVETQLVNDIVDQANGLVNDAQNELRLFLLATVLAILVSVVLALLVARATARPLQRLTVAANRLSTEQLPGLVEQLRNPDVESTSGFAAQLAPIDINSRDEIGQLADAFNTIQQVTLEVAEEQASLLRKGIGDIFINLARRNQTLLDRQIEFIDQLEANEEDPDQLDNLFKLDHLATRMRRNAESLLVLAGAEPPRRRGRPVALADVVRVAIGEVEDFARISLLSLDDAMVGGNVAVDLAHLLSELMENATHFSPPDTHVEVVGRAEPDGSFVLSISDQGIGMSTDQLIEANHQLANPPLVGLALSRSLGFIVIGRLAQRFDIVVELQSSPSGGIQALVRLPRDLVTDDQGQPLPIDEGAVAALAEPPAALEAPAEAEAELAEDEEYEIVEEIVLEEVDEDYAEGDEYEIVEEFVVEEVDEEPEPVTEEPTPEPATLEEAVPEGDAFDRGLESLISGETATAVEEPPAAPEPEPEPVAALRESEPATVAEPVEARVPAAPPSIGDVTAAGLVKRTPKKRSNSATGTGPLRTAATSQRPTGQTQRSPEEVRAMLSRYRGGLKKGRTGADEGTDNS